VTNGTTNYPFPNYHWRIELCAVPPWFAPRYRNLALVRTQNLSVLDSGSLFSCRYNTRYIGPYKVYFCHTHPNPLHPSPLRNFYHFHHHHHHHHHQFIWSFGLHTLFLVLHVYKVPCVHRTRRVQSFGSTIASSSGSSSCLDTATFI